MADQNDVDIQIRVKNLTKEAFDAVSKALKELEKQTESNSDKSSGFAGALTKFFQQPIDLSKTASIAMGGVAAGLVAVGAGIVALGSHGADVADVQAHFTRLNAEIGNNAKTMMGTLADATGHTISNFELMKSVNTAMSDGVRLTEKDFSTLGRASRVLADVTGGDTKTAFDTLADAMASGRTKALKSIGVTIDQKAALDSYATSLGKTSADLTDNELKLATQHAILRQLEGVLKKTGDAQDDFADAIARGQAFFANFTDDLSVGIASSPVFAAALGGMQKAMDAAFGGNSQGLIGGIIHLLEQGAIRMADFLQVGITVAGGLGRVFSAVQGVFDLVAAAVVNATSSAADSIAQALDLASKLPTVGDSFRGLAAGAHDVATNMAGMRDSLLEQSKEAWEGVKGNSAFQTTLDGVSKGVQTVRDAMIEASKKTSEHGETVENTASKLGKLAGATRDVVPPTKEAIEKAKEHAKEIEKLGQSLSGGGVLTGLANMNEALVKEGVNLKNLPLASLKSLNDAIEAGIALYRRRGEAAPAALRVEALAIKAALDEARRAQEEFDKLHGPMTFGKTAGVSLSAIPAAKNADGSVMGNGSLLSGRALGADMTNALLLGTSTLDTQKVAAAAAARMKLALGPGFWQASFGTPAEFGANVSGAIIGAIQGGGNVLGAAGGTIGTALGSGVAKSLASSLVKDGAGLFQKALGGVLSSALPVIGSLIGPLASALWGHFFGTAGRDAIKDFAQSVTGSSDLNALHKYLQDNLSGTEAESFWIRMTQGTGRNNPQQAAAAIDALTAAIAKHKQETDAAAASAGKFGETEQAAIDAATKAVADLDAEMQGLQQSINAEQTEDDMGIVERQQRARLAALQEQRAAAQQNLEDVQSAAEASAKATADAVDLELRSRDFMIKVRAQLDLDGGGSALPGHAEGAYIRQDHVARVHAGEMIGDQTFFGNAIAAALSRMEPGGGDQTIVLKLDGREVTRTVLKRQSATLASLGADGR